MQADDRAGAYMGARVKGWLEMKNFKKHYIPIKSNSFIKEKEESQVIERKKNKFQIPLLIFLSPSCLNKPNLDFKFLS